MVTVLTMHADYQLYSLIGHERPDDARHCAQYTLVFAVPTVVMLRLRIYASQTRSSSAPCSISSRRKVPDARPAF